MKRTWKPVVAGVINIVVGAFTLLGMFIAAVIIVGVMAKILTGFAMVC